MCGVLQFQSSSLRVADTALWQKPCIAFHLFTLDIYAFTRAHELNLHEIFECTHLKFTVYGRKQAYTQHMHNAVSLVYKYQTLITIS